MNKGLIAAAVMALTAVAMPTAGHAQYEGSAPYCVQVYTSSNIITRCDYASFEQCQAYNDGRNNTCTVNPYYRGPAPGPRRRGGYAGY